MKPLGFIDSDWVYNMTVICIALMSAGDLVGYKYKYQDMIAHSSMEAEFVVASDNRKNHNVFLFNVARSFQLSNHMP
jgi:hypothetical protein